MIPSHQRHAAFGSLAQPVEQRTFNPLVARSNRARPTRYRHLAIVGQVPFFLHKFLKFTAV